MKSVIITGGTGGLGRTVVERLSRDYHCVLLQRPEVDLLDDVSVRRALQRATDAVGAPYGLVHMAGGYTGGTIGETTLETWQQMLSLNLTTSFNAIRETLACMRRDAPGRIVAVSSAATLTKFSGAVAYTVAKSALNTLVESVANDLEGTAITINALVPGTLDTEASRAAMPDARRIPLPEVAESIAFLLSDAAAHLSGALIPLR